MKINKLALGLIGGVGVAMAVPLAVVFTMPNNKGIQGEKGDQGTQGLQGDQGIQGIQGIQGEKGDQGIQGIQGIQGEKGDQGIQGEKGDQGIQGIQGLQGEKGDQGIQGEKGDQGIQGIQGLQGRNGKNGLSRLSGWIVKINVINTKNNSQGTYNVFIPMVQINLNEEFIATHVIQMNDNTTRLFTKTYDEVLFGNNKTDNTSETICTWTVQEVR